MFLIKPAKTAAVVKWLIHAINLIFKPLILQTRKRKQAHKAIIVLHPCVNIYIYIAASAI